MTSIDNSNLKSMNTEELREFLLNGVYTAAFSGFPSVAVLINTVKNADHNKLVDMAKQLGYEI